MRCHLECDVANELIQRRLGNAEIDHAAAWMARRLRSNVKQTTEATADHGRHSGFGEKKSGVHFPVEFPAELFPAQIGERRDVIRDERIVHEHIGVTQWRSTALNISSTSSGAVTSA
jgi:hypothetical protein